MLRNRDGTQGTEMPARLKSIVVFAVWFCLFVLVQVADAQSSSDACDLPKDLRSVVERKYAGTKVVSVSDLSEEDKQLYQKEHSDSCPGLVKVDFYGDGKPTFALALTTKSQTYPTTKLVLAHQAESNWEVTTLDKADGPSSSGLEREAGRIQECLWKEN